MSEDRTPNEPMLDIARGDRARSQHLRRSLEVLRERTDDPEFRRQLDQVLAGRMSLREAALTGTFARGLTPHFMAGMRRWEQVSEEDRERLAEQGKEAFERLNAQLAREQGTPPSGGGRDPAPPDDPPPPDAPPLSSPAAPVAPPPPPVIPTVLDSERFRQPDPAAPPPDPDREDER